MRRRLLLALALVVGVFVFPSSASATPDPPPNNDKHDFVVGGFQFFEGNWAVSAHSGPLGEEPFGHVSLTVSEGSSEETFGVQGRWRVTCVNVDGPLAAIGVVPTQAASNDQVGVPWVLVFSDGGPGGGTPEDPDRFEMFLFAPHVCQSPLALELAATSADPIESGNILVHDAQP